MKDIYYNGTIITLEEKMFAECVMVEDGKIKYVGDLEKIRNEEKNANFIDLEGKTLMPSFIDPHSHIAAFTSTLLICDLSNATSYDDIVNMLIKYKNENKIKEGKWIIGFGYDHNNLIEKKHPLKEVLDRVSLDLPIMISHKSGHMGVLNTKAIKLLNLEEKFKNKEIGEVSKDSYGKLNGYLEETNFIGVLGNANSFSIEDLKKAYKKAEDIYLSYGITTAQDGLTKEQEFYLLKSLSDENKLNIDVVSYIDIKDNSFLLENNKKYLSYINNYRIGGYKLILDGSPQGKTAWMSKPYEGEKDYSGYGAYNDEEVEGFVEKSINDNVQLLTHCNGDASSEQLINSFEKVKEKLNINIDDLKRPVMIHAQTVRLDQIKRMKKIEMIPSFFGAHVYHWGDIHLKNLGNRALNLSPAKWAIENGLIYTFHQDTPVILPDMWETIWCLCKRITKEGVVLDNQKISVLDAIKGVTLNAAYQYFEEDKKGSIKVGKNADFIVVSDNPLDVEIDKLRDIHVLKTIKNGKILFKKKEI